MDIDRAGIVQGVEVRRDLIWDLSRRIYQHPEMGYSETLASDWIAGILGDAGFRVSRPVAGLATAFMAVKKGCAPGPRVALFAEYDALPELGHGCGHNFIAAASVGAALALAGMMDNAGGELMVLGCPAEEGCVEGAGGKVILLEKGCLSGVDAALMVHPGAKTIVEATSAERVALRLTYRGKAGHAGSRNSRGVNALDAAIETFNAWKELNREMGQDVLIHGIISKGGVSPNIIPDLAEVMVYLRSSSGGNLPELETRARACATRAARAAGARVEFAYCARTYLCMRTNVPLAMAFSSNLQNLKVKIHDHAGASMGSTDMGNVSQKVPSVHAYLSLGGRVPPAHTREFGAATLRPGGLRATVTAAKALALTAWDVLVIPELVKEIRMFHKSRR
ncbi:MAG: amidohydrolase [Bacillota bacterium]